MHDSVSREYKLYVPESYDATTPVPLMLNFHGFGGSSLEQLRSSDMRALAESENFILIYPQGTMLEGYAHWNTYLPGGDNKSDVDDFGFVEAMLDELSLNYAIDSDRVYATGYSNGGDFTYTLACFLSDRVTGIASVSGLMWEGTLSECVTTHPTAVLSIHGTSDNSRPYDGWEGYLLSIVDSTAFWNDQNNITSAATITNVSNNIERFDYVGGDGNVANRHYKIRGGGHIWFSITDDGIQTDQIIWEYLSQFDQSGVR
jgi:polyhydroxybutyrate depolymerase